MRQVEEECMTAGLRKEGREMRFVGQRVLLTLVGFPQG